MDPDQAPDPDPTPDLTSYFSDFKDAKQLLFFHIFSYNLLVGPLSSVLKIYFLLNFVLKQQH
jgi:hypothetical protein